MSVTQNSNIGENKTKNLYRQQQLTFETNPQKKVRTAEKISTADSGDRQTNKEQVGYNTELRRSQQERLADEREE